MSSTVLVFSADEIPGCEEGNIFNTNTGLPCYNNSEGSCPTNWTGVYPVCTAPGSDNPSMKSQLYVSTITADNITQNSATLHGTGGYEIGTPRLLPPTLPITAYFRYSTLPISPVFCNDIYGSRMTATTDIRLNTISGVINRENFAKSISGLQPNTTYYYCAIVSNAENIAYGGREVVKEFRTNCIETDVETKNATNIRSNSVRLNGSYCSTQSSVKTSFEHKEKTVSGQTTPTPWIKVGETNRVRETDKSNVYGNFSFNLSGLKSNTEYQFRAVAETSTENPVGITKNFTTTPAVPSSCVYPKIYSASANACVNPPPPTCTSPRVLDTATNTCITPPPTCLPTHIYNPQTNTCVTRTVCTPPQVYFTPTNGCVTPPVCTSPQVLNQSTNVCVTPPVESFCEANPTDASCLPGPGWSYNPDTNTWNGGNWNGGTWSGGSWNNGRWSGGTWTGNSGCIWSGGVWSNGVWTGGSCSGSLTLGQTATPPSDAIVRYHEGIETVFARQISRDIEFAKKYGYQEGADMQTFAGEFAHLLAQMFGYVDESGREIRVSLPDIAAYQLQVVGNKLTVYEYYNGKIVDIRNITSVFKSASGYEYYFKK